MFFLKNLQFLQLMIIYNIYIHSFSLSLSLIRNMKLEPQDDGYETSADLLLSNTASMNHDIKCEKIEDPYSFIDDDPLPMMTGPQGPPCMNTVQQFNNQILPGPKKRGRKKKIKPEQ